MLFLPGGPLTQGRLPLSLAQIPTLPQTLSHNPGPGLSSPPPRAQAVSVASWPSSGHAGLMNVGLWLQARPRPALQNRARGLRWPLCSSAPGQRCVWFWAKPAGARARISTQPQGLCLQCVCDQHPAGSSSCPDSQAPAFGPPFLCWDGVRGRPSWQEP